MAQAMTQAKRPPLDVVRMFPQIQDIQDTELRQTVIDIWLELWEQSEWQDIGDPPVSAEIPYPNLPHSQCVVVMALAVADAFEKFHNVRVNRDYLIAAAVLQDASKVVEYAPPGPDGKVRRTSIGKNYGHGFWCAHLAIAKGLPEEITHVILTHSPMATKFPDSLEGKILYYVDQLDVIGIHKDRWKKHILVGK
jgi:hypothetical protein